jgi:hypothetical protein
MEFREFLEKASEEVSLLSNSQVLYGYVSSDNLSSMSDDDLESLIFERSWVSGGSTGKSCWGGEAYSRSADAPEDITPDVAKVLMAVGKENISFVVYMAKIQPLVQSTDLSDNSDYYGNYTTYSRVYMNLKELYDVLYGERDD